MAAGADVQKKPSRIQLENRAAIMAAALAVFSADGFRGATVGRIAEAAGMSKPNLLYYYPSKEDIYRALLESLLEDWLEPLAAMDPEGEPVAELERYIRRKVAIALARPAESRLFASEILRGAPLMKQFLGSELRAQVEEKAAVLRGWMAAGRLAPVDPHHLIFAIWAVTQHYADFDVQVSAVLGAEAPAAAPGAVADAVVAILLRGVEVRA